MHTLKPVTKTKSSNSCATNKSFSPERNKSCSNAQVQENQLKKRGVYVEKRITSGELNQAARLKNSTGNKRPKSFFDPVFAVFKKGSLGTQYPEIDITKPGKPRKIRRRIGVTTVDRSTQDLDALYTRSIHSMHSPRARKQKYRSRVLNCNIDDKFEVLQAKRNLDQTSNYSNRDLDGRYPSDIPLQEKEILSTFLETNTDTNDIVEVKDDRGIDEEGKKPKKILRIEEPRTLISDYKSNPKHSMYNFFVDLLETTISVYNTDCNYNPSIGKVSTKDQLHIAESVAKKLNNRVKIRESDDCCYKRDNKFYVLSNDDNMTDNIHVYKTKPRYTHKNPPPVLKHKFALRNMSLPTPKKHNRRNMILPSSEIKPKKEKKQKKPTLLDMLKEELQMDDEMFREPENLHEALQEIAKNKRRCRRTIHFDESSIPKKTQSNDEGQSQFKHRKIISSTNKSTKRNKNFKLCNPEMMHMKSVLTKKLRRKISTYSSDSSSLHESDIEEKPVNRRKDYSNHSIEVKAYDYDIPGFKDIAKKKSSPKYPSRNFDGYSMQPSNEKRTGYKKLSSQSMPSESIESFRDFCLEEICCNSNNSATSTTIGQLLMADSTLKFM